MGVFGRLGQNHLDYLNSFCSSAIRESFSCTYKCTIAIRANKSTKQNAFFGFEISLRKKGMLRLIFLEN